jgi:hypothetical protein
MVTVAVLLIIFIVIIRQTLTTTEDEVLLFYVERIFQLRISDFHHERGISILYFKTLLLQA